MIYFCAFFHLVATIVIWLVDFSFLKTRVHSQL
jgi:hypothetical protein